MDVTVDIKNCGHRIIYLEANSRSRSKNAYCFSCKDGPFGFTPSEDLRVGARYNGMELYWFRNGNGNGSGHSHSMSSTSITSMRRHRGYRDVEIDDETVL